MVGWCDGIHSTSCYNHCHCLFSSRMHTYNGAIIFMEGICLDIYASFLADNDHYDLFKNNKPGMIWCSCFVIILIIMFMLYYAKFYV